MIREVILRTSGMYEEKNHDAVDYELWKSIAENMDGEHAFVIDSMDNTDEFCFIGLKDKSKDKELFYMMEQDSLTGSFIKNRNDFDIAWDSGEYERECFFRIEQKWLNLM